MAILAITSANPVTHHGKYNKSFLIAFIFMFLLTLVDPRLIQLSHLLYAIPASRSSSSHELSDEGEFFDKRDSYSPWAGKRSYSPWAGKRSSADDIEDNGNNGDYEEVQVAPQAETRLKKFLPWAGKKRASSTPNGN